jgi:hypothetical protein
VSELVEPLVGGAMRHGPNVDPSPVSVSVADPVLCPVADPVLCPVADPVL